MKRILTIMLVSLLSACATGYNPIPEGYTGKTATIEDTMSNLTGKSAHYFICEKVDGNYITNSWGDTRNQNSGRGMSFDPVMTSRQVLPSEQTLTIRGFVFFPTDAQSMFADKMIVTHDFPFTPVAGETYRVKGELNKSGSTVWLEDSRGNMVDGSKGKSGSK